MKIKYSFLAQSAAIPTTTLLRVPDGTFRDYLISIYVVDRGGTLAAAGGAQIIWNDDIGGEFISTQSAGFVGFAHVNPGTNISVHVPVGAGVSDFDVIVCVEEIK